LFKKWLLVANVEEASTIQQILNRGPPSEELSVELAVSESQTQEF